MGKLHLQESDINRLAEILERDIAIEGDALIVDLGGPKLWLTALSTKGHFEQNGVRFDIAARFENGGLDVDID